MTDNSTFERLTLSEYDDGPCPWPADVYRTALKAAYAEIDRLRANALEWVTVTEDPSSMPSFNTRVLVCPHGTPEAPRIMWRYTYHMWTSARDYSNWVQITPGDRWAYIQEAQA